MAGLDASAKAGKTPEIAPSRAPGLPGNRRRRTVVLHRKVSENNRLTVTAPVAAKTAVVQRPNHPLIAPPPIPPLSRKHLNGMIGLMILLWCGFMAAVVYKGTTPLSGYYIFEDR